jgi:hypothetical protein
LKSRLSSVNDTAESGFHNVFHDLKKEYLGEFAAVCENILGCESVTEEMFWETIS